MPFTVRHYHDANVSFYGSGRAKVVSPGSPIMILMPWTWESGWLRLTVPNTTRKEDVYVLRKITAATAGPASSRLGVTDADQFPTLVEYPTATKYPTGEDRQPSSLIVVIEGGVWKVGVLDKDNNRSLWRTGASLLDVMLAAEEALSVDDPSHWRASNAKGKGSRK